MLCNASVSAGVSLSLDPFIVGQTATVRCISDIETTTMEWLHNQEVVKMVTSTQLLDLVFSPANDSIHGQVYVCRVTGEDGVHSEQNFTVRVDGNLSLSLAA